MRGYNIRAWAKLNLALDVGEKRGDGYHEMTMVMQTASLYDEVRIEPGSRLASAYGETHHRVVNSIHHQAVERVAPGFHAVAWAPDGTIEAIEPDDPAAPILAVQWHPEKITTEGDHTLFRYFVETLVRR